MHWWLGYSPHKPDCHLSYKKWHSGLKKSAEIRLWLFLECPKRYTLCSYEMLKIITWQNQFDIRMKLVFGSEHWFRGELLLQIWYIKSENLIRSLDSRTQLICQQNISATKFNKYFVQKKTWHRSQGGVNVG